MRLKNVLFVLLDEFADWEFAHLASALNEEPDETPRIYQAKTLSITQNPIRSIGGLTVIPDYDLTDFPQNYAALILIGGNSWRKPISKKILPLVAQTIEKNLILGAICDASFFLVDSGFLNNIQHTSNDLNDLKQNAKNYKGEALFQSQQAVKDGQIITANGTACLEFAREILLALKSCTR